MKQLEPILHQNKTTINEKNPKSLIGRFWRWQINFCPSWRGYFKSLPPEKQEEIRKKYDFWKYQ